jgi:hypothetical protein
LAANLKNLTPGEEERTRKNLTGEEEETRKNPNRRRRNKQDERGSSSKIQKREMLARVAMST